MDLSSQLSEEKWMNIMVDSQILSSFMSCPRKMNYTYNCHLVPTSGKSTAFAKGGLAHKGLAVYYESLMAGMNLLEAKNEAIKKFNQFAPTVDIPSEDVILVKRTLEEFLEYRGSRDSWTPRAVEKVIKFLAYEDPSIRLRIILTGRIDLIVSLSSNPTQLIPVDHKSESETWFYSALSNQFKIYALATKSKQLVVQRFGFQKTVKPEKKFAQETINFTDDVLDEFQNEVLPYYIKEMVMCMESGYYPPNYASCITGHFACTYADKHQHGVCHLSRSDRANKIARYFTIAQEWNPEDEV